MWKSIFSHIAIFTTILAIGQQEQQRVGKPKASFKPHELKIGINAIRGGRTLFGSEVITHEVQGALAMHKAILILDLGVEENRRGDTYSYANKGNYFRIGADWNFTKNHKSGNVLSLGLRYARASFNDDLQFTSDQGFGEVDYTFENSNLQARWAELTFNLRGKVVSDLFMGFTMRWQFSRKINGEGDLKTFEVPGFGKTKRRNSTAFDYYLMWRIPFKN